MNVLSIVLIAGFSLLILFAIGLPFIHPLGFLFLGWIFFSLLSIVFLVFAFRVRKNLKDEEELEIQAMFVFILVALGFQCLLFNGGEFEWLGFTLLLVNIGMGIVVRKSAIKLEIISWALLAFLSASFWMLWPFLN